MGSYFSKRAESPTRLPSTTISQVELSDLTSRIAQPDVLLSILYYLDTEDLARCLRVNRQFLLVAGRMLYRQPLRFNPYGIPYGEKRHRPSLFAGTGLLPSSFLARCLLLLWPAPKALARKLNQLAEIRDIEIFLHRAYQCPSAALVGHFPSVHTLRITNSYLPPDDGVLARQPEWSCPIFAAVRPTCVIIGDRGLTYTSFGDPSQCRPVWRVPLRTLYSGCVEHVQVISYDLAPNGSLKYGAVEVDWPLTMKRLDIGFYQLAGSRWWAPSPADVTTPIFDPKSSDGGVKHVCAIVKLLLSASHIETQITLVGFGTVERVGRDYHESVSDKDAEIEDEFAARVRAAYGAELQLKGIGPRGISEKLEALHIVLSKS
ncbi:uncharacterized protein MKK02DRAFT_44879 [Dioszegia hungarica]|uniref:F-box domain-containing protein n=1 Tax=Dioszegia hungarica TaxID=4972 RepID=A0AA38HBW6_9TREE|nr:uncharacterized protein MKK02DRAFT_44879 [Dioszegia hungarica]KAI9636176.1 hypothetical protein MKK02DRAFT_44879 [Dioszegia hungarica]